MPIVDVRSHLTDPTDAALATAEIDDLGADLQAAGGARSSSPPVTTT